ncbi:hypothetical protein G9A89_007283 [Geosiphon pyriformis]|nr:hypothetical protein G9A89_007283 [Geosiphon pyriformis]
MVKLLSLVSLLVALPASVLALPSTEIFHHRITIKFQHQVEPVKSLTVIKNTNDEDSEDLRLIQTAENKPAVWMTESEIWELFRQRVKFMDITDYEDLGKTFKINNGKTREFPVEPKFQEEVTPFLADLTTKYMQENLEKFTSFRTRYYKSRSGASSSDWLYEKIADIIATAPDKNVVSVRKFKHNWGQNSIIARFNGTEPNKENEVVIVGAHQDSVNMWFPSFGSAPGADDDGSGTVTILEAFRVLVKGGFKPVRPVEFHWYSAEEGGLLGSQAIAIEYEKQGRDVIAMLQNDMTGYVGKKPESFGIITDYVDPQLTVFIKALVEKYAKIPWKDTECGYACSDHASWRKAGYPSAFTIESEFHDSNPYIHTSNDVIKNLDFNHMLEFSKLSVSYAVELSHI